MDYTPSYTPTLSALISARAPNTNSLPSSVPHLLVVAHPGGTVQLDGRLSNMLDGVAKELSAIQRQAPDRVHSLVGADATRNTVLNELPNHPWVHFACHGHLIPSEPFNSAFELDRELLTLHDLLQARLPNADLAFLAACDSATSGGTSNTPDEALHLAAAVQFGGFRSVIGTLWPIDDRDGRKVAQAFYNIMFEKDDSRQSADVLRQVILKMKNRKGPWRGDTPKVDRWAGYIHIGA